MIYFQFNISCLQILTIFWKRGNVFSVFSMIKHQNSFILGRVKKKTCDNVTKNWSTRLKCGRGSAFPGCRSFSSGSGVTSSKIISDASSFGQILEHKSGQELLSTTPYLHIHWYLCESMICKYLYI